MYQISKGWPSDAAIDEVFKAASGQELHEGMIVKLDANHEGSVANSVPTDGTLVFVIGHEFLNKTFTGLMHPCVITCDKDCFDDTATWTGGALVTVGTGGKFKPAGDNDTAIGRVLAYDATTGILRIHWFESK